MNDESFRTQVRDALGASRRTAARGRSTRRPGTGSRRRLHYVPGDLGRPRHVRRAERAAGGDRRRASSRRRRGTSSISPCRPASTRRRIDQLAESGSRRGCTEPQAAPLGPDHHREAVRPEPGERGRAERARAQRLRRAPGVPHRPLPGQGDGPEPPGVPVRQLDLRAGVEPAARAPRADHRRGDAWASSTGQVLRGSGGGAGHVPEPPPPAAHADGDGAAGHLQRRRRARREGEGAARHPADHSGGEMHDYSVRGQYGPGTVNGKRGSRLPARSRMWLRTVATPDLWLRSASWSTTGAGRACRSILRSGKRMPRRVSEIAIQFREPPHLMFPLRAWPDHRAQHPRDPGAAGGGHLARVRGQGARRRRQDDRGPDMDFSYAEAFGPAGPLGLRDAAARLHAGRRHAVHPERRGRGRVGGGGSGDRGLARQGPEHFPNYAAGTWGPAVADEFIARDGARWRQP